MSKATYASRPAAQSPFGEWLRQLRTERGLPLRVVAEAAEMDLAHLQKIELGQRLPTEEQTLLLVRFFDLDERATQARRIAERFRQEFADHPAAADAIQILAETAGVYSTVKRNGRNSR
jgi:transcriptional regulator with XRE-family HTH domain